MSDRTMTQRLSATPLLLALLCAAACGSAQAAADDHAAWRRAVATLQAAGFTAVEELETTAFGGFEAEVFDREQQSFEVQLDAQGAMLNQRLEARSSPEERIESARLLGLLDWLTAQGYRGTRSISADDGHLEVETEDAAGLSLELDLQATAEGWRLLRSERD